jgi:hypothetical protein
LGSGCAEILQVTIFIEGRRIESLLEEKQMSREFWNNERKVIKWCV